MFVSVGNKLRISVLLLFVVYLVSSQTGCPSPLLQRAEVVNRFGGSGNILNTSTAAAASLPICKFLQGQNVCVSNAGFSAFRNYFDSWKADVLSHGSSRNYDRFRNIATQVPNNASDCVEKYLYWSAFIGYSVAAQVQTSGSIDYAALNSVAQQSVNVQLTNLMREANNPAQMFSQLENLRTDTVNQKAACARTAYKYLIYSTCRSADPNWGPHMTGTSANPTFFVKTGFCTKVKSACLNYFTDLKMIGQISLLFSVCNSADVATVTNLLKGQSSSANNPQLNTIWQSNRLTYPSVTAVTTPKVAANLECDNLTTTAADCNFMCNSVFTASGFRANDFHDLNDIGTSRLLHTVDNGTGIVGESSEASVSDPDLVISADEVGVVSAEPRIGTGATALLVNGIVLLGIFIAALL